MEYILNRQTKACVKKRNVSPGEDAGKTKITKAFREVVARYESEAAEAEARENCPANDILVFEYMCSWLEKAKKALQYNTYQPLLEFYP